MRAWILALGFLMGGCCLPLYAALEESFAARIDWKAGYVEAQGTGLEPDDRRGTPRGELMAKRAAEMDMKRELLKQLEGAHLDSTTTVKDGLRDEQTTSLVGGVIGDVEILQSSFEGGVYSITGRVSMDALRRLALRRTPAGKAVGGGTITSLVIDARSVSVTPSVTFRVLDSKGQVLYSLAQADRQAFLAKGLCRYLNGGADQRGLSVLTRATYVTAVGTASGGVDLVIENRQAALLAGPQPFKRTCSVVVLTNNL